MNKSFFYRVHHPKGLGLWYNQDGAFTSMVTKLNVNCKDLDMSHDDECVGGYLSCTDSLDTLLQWFSKEEITMLSEHGYELVVFESDNYKMCNKYNHHLIHATSAKQIAAITLL